LECFRLRNRGPLILQQVFSIGYSVLIGLCRPPKMTSSRLKEAFANAITATDRNLFPASDPAYVKVRDMSLEHRSNL